MEVFARGAKILCFGGGKPRRGSFGTSANSGGVDKKSKIFPSRLSW